MTANRGCISNLNFAPSFKNWVQLFFSGRKTYLLLNGYLLEQGVPQGDVLSPYIFNICVEILQLKICYTKELEEVKFEKRESRNWIWEDLLNTAKDKGGLGFFRLKSFIGAMKVIWSSWLMPNSMDWAVLQKHMQTLWGTIHSLMNQKRIPGSVENALFVSIFE